MTVGELEIQLSLLKLKQRKIRVCAFGEMIELEHIVFGTIVDGDNGDGYYVIDGVAIEGRGEEWKPSSH